MNYNAITRVSGSAGVLATVLILVELPLYFLYDGPPPDWNIVTRSMAGLAGNTILVIFLAGLPVLAWHAGPVRAWVGGVAAVAGVMWLTVSAVATALEVGAAIAAPEDLDPTIAVTGTYVLYGALSKLLMALFLGAFAFAFAEAGIVPRWITTGAAALAVVQLCFVPSMFFGNNPADFYAANGWGTTATTGGLTILWILLTALTILRSRTASTTVPA
ncbi:hypothetical protein [Nocardia amamiensis]|uniref:hypothetical protein n=1 Tax=Nocardia amamiensis TaxID=404578 RepID=UPI0008329245|nr:hypothetical protein [Nocardia amamiensis]